MRIGLSKNYRSLTDSELVAECIPGSEAAWDELLRRHGGLIFSTIRRMGLSSLDAEDVFQSVCILLLENLTSLREGQKLTGWLMAVARRETLRWLRRQRPTSELPTTEREATDDLPEKQLAALEDRHLLERGLERLGERCQTLLIALYLTEPAPSYEAIAQERSWPVGSVGPNRARCLERLRVELEKLGY